MLSYVEVPRNYIYIYIYISRMTLVYNNGYHAQYASEFRLNLFNACVALCIPVADCGHT